MNSKQIYLSSFLIKLKICTLIIVNISKPPPLDPKSFDIQRILWKRSELLWAYVNYKKNNILTLLVSTQKLYFGDDDAFYDVIIQEMVWKWRDNYRHGISKDQFAE